MANDKDSLRLITAWLMILADLCPGGEAMTKRRTANLALALVGDFPTGAFTTASGLTFVGATDDNRFRAFKTATGEQVWEKKLPSSIEDSPVTYQSADGRQFITAIATGGGIGTATTEVQSDVVMAFALPKK